MIMQNTFRETLDSFGSTLGTHFLFADPDIPEIIADSAFLDYVWFRPED